MGAEQFTNMARGKTAQEAFTACVEEALYAYGHAGYTGTIGEKPSFRFFGKAEGVTAYELENAIFHFADGGENLPKKFPQLVDIINDDLIAVYDDKWGPAVCVELDRGDESEEEERLFLFCGYASS